MTSPVRGHAYNRWNLWLCEGTAGQSHGRHVACVCGNVVHVAGSRSLPGCVVTVKLWGAHAIFLHMLIVVCVIFVIDCDFVCVM